MLTVKQAAEYLNCSAALVYQLAAARKLAHFRVGTRRGSLRFRTEDLDAYLQRCRVEARVPHEPPPRKHRGEFKHLNL